MYLNQIILWLHKDSEDLYNLVFDMLQVYTGGC